MRLDLPPARRTTGRDTEGIPPELIPPPRPAMAEAPEPVTGGVNVAGYFRAEAGVGEAARHLLRGLDRAGIPHSTFTYEETLSRQGHAFEERGDLSVVVAWQRCDRAAERL